jgi:FdhE protein
VAGNFLRKWFGGPGPAPAAVDEARAELDRLAAGRPALQPVFHWLRELLPSLVPLVEATPPLQLDPERARRRLAEGIPLLRNEPLALDLVAFRRRWHHACRALEEQQRDGTAAALDRGLGEGRLDPMAMMEAVVAGHPEAVREQAELAGLDPVLAATFLRFVLFPVYTALDASLAPLREGSVWERGYCPTCGSWPLLGEFRGLDQSRFLRCGLCAANWPVPRLWCPFCGNARHEQLGFLHNVDEEGRYRAAVCEACRGYVKMVTTLAALPPLHLLLADALTLHLDLMAAQRGYANPP